MPDDLLVHVDDVVAGYVPEVNILNGCSLELAPRRADRHHRAQRRGQVDDAQGAVRPDPGRAAAPCTTGARTSPGRRPTRSSPRASATCPQINNVFPSLTVEENLEMGGYLRKGGSSERLRLRRRAVPPARRADRPAGRLAVGRRAPDAGDGPGADDGAEVLLLDEPSAGLSPLLQDQVFERVEQVNDAGVSIIMVEQNAARCLQICDRGYVLDQGRNAYTGTGERAADRPQGHRALPRHARQGPLTPNATSPNRQATRDPLGAGTPAAPVRRAAGSGWSRLRSAQI